MFQEPTFDKTGEDLQTVHLPSTEEFGWFAFVILAFQVVVAVTFSVYAWIIENEYVSYVLIYIAQGWFNVFIWESTLPHGCQSSERFLRTSFAVTIVSLNPTIIPFVNGHLKEESFGHYISVPVVTLVSAIVAYNTLSSMRGCLRKQCNEEAALIRLAQSHLNKAFWAGLVIVFLFATGITGFGGQSMEDVGQNMDVLQKVKNNQGFIDQDYMEAKKDLQGLLQVFQSIFVGSALNITLACYVLTGDILKFTFVDVIQFKINWIEKVMTFCYLLMVVCSLAFFKLDESQVGYGLLLSIDDANNGFNACNTLLILILGSGFLIFCFSWYASHSILTNADNYVYFRERVGRVTTDQQRQIALDNLIQDLTSNQSKQQRDIGSLEQGQLDLKIGLDNLKNVMKETNKETKRQ